MLVILSWVSENAEIVITILGIIGVLVKQRHDNHKNKIAREETVRSANRDRAAFELDQEAKRAAHQQDMENRSANEISKLNEWFQKQIEFQDKKINDLDTRNTALQTRIGELSTENGLLKGLIESHKHQITGLQTEITELRGHLRDYQTENHQLINENTHLQNMLHEENQRNLAAQEANRGHLAVIAELRERVKDLDMEVRAAESTIAAQADIIKRSTKDDDTKPIPVIATDDADGIDNSITNEHTIERHEDGILE